jgi:hypothetical protein
VEGQVTGRDREEERRSLERDINRKDRKQAEAVKKSEGGRKEESQGKTS